MPYKISQTKYKKNEGKYRATWCHRKSNYPNSIIFITLHSMFQLFHLIQALVDCDKEEINDINLYLFQDNPLFSIWLLFLFG